MTYCDPFEIQARTILKLTAVGCPHYFIHFGISKWQSFFATIAASGIDGMRMLMYELLHPRYDVHWVWILMHALLFSDRHTNFRGATLQFYSHACVTIRVSTVFEVYSRD